LFAIVRFLTVPPPSKQEQVWGKVRSVWATALQRKNWREKLNQTIAMGQSEAREAKKAKNAKYQSQDRPVWLELDIFGIKSLVLGSTWTVWIECPLWVKTRRR
jgi:ABC-type hemin transport system substrate-binding protein